MSLVLKDVALAKSQLHKLNLVYIITGAKDVRKARGSVFQSIEGFDAGDFVQSNVDALVGSGQIVVGTQFGSTAMGTDAFGVILRTNGGTEVGQIKKIAYMRVTVAGVPMPIVEASDSALPNTLTQGIAKTENGDLYLRLIYTGLDSDTSGEIEIEIAYEAI